VRRAKLYYLRGRVGKRARVRERRSNRPEEVIERELLYGPEAEEAGTELEDGAATEAVGAGAPEAETVPEAESPAAEAEAPETAASAPPEAEGEAPEATAAPPEPAADERSGAGESEGSVPATAPQDAGPAAAEPSAGEEKV
jgi:large subunit ribosomal protein L19